MGTSAPPRACKGQRTNGMIQLSLLCGPRNQIQVIKLGSQQHPPPAESSRQPSFSDF